MRGTIRRNKYNIFVFIIAFAVIGGVVMFFATRAATPVTVDNSLPNPTNVKAYADDRVATVMWDPAPDADSRGIIGYYITWGAQSGGVFTNAKQTEYTVTQIQPLTNGVVYNVKVQSVHGSFANVPTPDGWGGGASEEGRASGRVSNGNGATTTVTPSSARVDQLRQKMTGFFDDFNTPAGAFDELKWNHAASCIFYGSGGAFLNNQFHAHNQLRSGGYSEDVAPCWDRGQMASRPRGVFDISGTSESNPGEIVFDFDGVQFGRDVWYIDLVPTTERTTGVPIDVNTHQGSDDDLGNPTIHTEPKMIRMAQLGAQDGSGGLIHFMYYGDDQLPHEIVSTNGCTDQFKGWLKFNNCGGQAQNTSLSPLPEPNVFSSQPIRIPVANVRAHWRMQISSTKIKVFINNVLMWEGPMPADYRNTTKYHVYSTLFSYNTGKDQGAKNSTTMLHWDNFGFTGPAPTTETHNYLEGGPTGTVPVFGPGTLTNRIPTGVPRSTKVNIPDSIGSPTQARLMFTVNATGYSGRYPWGSGDTVTVNNKSYSVPNPANFLNGTVPRYDDGSLIPPSAAFSISVPLNTADLKQGMNDVVFNLQSASGAVMVSNAHIELDYPTNNKPSYTSPTQIFGATAMLASVQPVMNIHDNYLFIEQDFGLPTGVIASTPGTGDTQNPTVSIVSPTNGASVQKGSGLTVDVNATDNVAIDKVVLYLDNGTNPYHTITHTPYSHTLDTSTWTVGSHTIRAQAYDTTGNNSYSQTITFNVTDPTPPPTTIPGDLNGDGKVNVFDLSTLLSNWGRTGATKSQGDVDGNGTVNIFDMSTLLANWSR